MDQKDELKESKTLPQRAMALGIPVFTLGFVGFSQLLTGTTPAHPEGLVLLSGAPAAIVYRDEIIAWGKRTKEKFESRKEGRAAKKVSSTEASEKAQQENAAREEPAPARPLVEEHENDQLWRLASGGK